MRTSATQTQEQQMSPFQVEPSWYREQWLVDSKPSPRNRWFALVAARATVSLLGLFGHAW
jgi:hypothetical protein